MASLHIIIHRMEVVFHSHHRVIIFGMALVLLALTQGPSLAAIACDNWGSHFLDRALLVDPASRTINLVVAGQNFQTALRYKPRYSLPYYNLGTIYTQWGDVTASAEAFARAVTVDPHDPLAYFQLGLAQAELGDEATARQSWQHAGAGAFFARRARAYFNAGDLEAAIFDAQRSIEIAPANTAGYDVLADAYVNQQNVEAALQVYWTVPNQVEGSYKAGLLLRRLGRTEEAIQILQQVIAQAPDHVNARLELGHAYTAQGDCDRVYSVLQPMLVRQLWRAPESRAFIVVGRCLLQQNDPLAAIAYLREAVALDTKSIDAYWLLGQAYEITGYREAAIEMYRQVLALRPNHAQAAKALEALGASMP